MQVCLPVSSDSATEDGEGDLHMALNHNQQVGDPGIIMHLVVIDGFCPDMGQGTGWLDCELGRHLSLIIHMAHRQPCWPP